MAAAILWFSARLHIVGRVLALGRPAVSTRSKKVQPAGKQRSAVWPSSENGIIGGTTRDSEVFGVKSPGPGKLIEVLERAPATANK